MACERKSDGARSKLNSHVAFSPAQLPWMSPYTVQSVYHISFLEPPESSLTDLSVEQRAEFDAASRKVSVAMCLPDGYVILESQTANAAVASSSSSAATAALCFSSPLVKKSSMNALLMHASPVYVRWFEAQMMEQMRALEALQQLQQDDDDDDGPQPEEVQD